MNFRDLREKKVAEKKSISIPDEDMGTVIKDFQKSDAPQFKGKSDKKRREMAIAAKLQTESTEERALEDINEMFDQDAALKIFNALKKGDKIKIGFDSSIKKGNENTYVVKSKSKSAKYNLEKITLKNVASATGLTSYLYNRQGKVTMAQGDMGAVITDMSIDMKESVEEAKAPALKSSDYAKGTYQSAQAFKDKFASKEEIQTQIDKAERYLKSLGGGNARSMQTRKYAVQSKIAALKARLAESAQKPVSQMTPKEKAKHDARRKEYQAYQKSKRNEELEEKYEWYADETGFGPNDMIRYGQKQGYKVVGLVGTTNRNQNDIYLFPLDSYDKKYVQGANVKNNETVFRYANSATVAGDIFPLVKINIKKGLMYHLTQESSTGEIDEVKFETRAVKLKYARFLQSANINESAYEDFFNAAMKKFGVKSPADFKSEKERKKFFDYVDKNYEAENELDEKMDDKTKERIRQEVKDGARSFVKPMQRTKNAIMMDRLRKGNAELRRQLNRESVDPVTEKYQPKTVTQKSTAVDMYKGTWTPGKDQQGGTVFAKYNRKVQMKKDARLLDKKAYHIKHGNDDAAIKVWNSIPANQNKCDESIDLGEAVDMNKVKKLLAPTKNSNEGIKVLVKSLGVSEKEAEKLIQQSFSESVKVGKTFKQIRGEL